MVSHANNFPEFDSTALGGFWAALGGTANTSSVGYMLYLADKCVDLKQWLHVEACICDILLDYKNVTLIDIYGFLRRYCFTGGLAGSAENAEKFAQTIDKARPDIINTEERRPWRYLVEPNELELGPRYIEGPQFIFEGSPNLRIEISRPRIREAFDHYVEDMMLERGIRPAWKFQ